ncbi:MAG: phosphoribosylglycinamide formyltransferase [Candidatus Kapabacteria bacterium]|nr:phosphoribosylglycinamide formyltransferase [Candidatus Kapabacteria bacterium]
MTSTPKLRIAVLGSGTGSNARALCRACAENDLAYSVALIVSTSEKAGICDVAHEERVSLAILEPPNNGKPLADALEQVICEHAIDVLVLAGFMRLLPQKTIDVLHGRVLNIHPALLPDFGGQGMFGIHVHEAVIASGATETGATIHVVTGDYDKGEILAQSKIRLLPGESSTDLQARVKTIEHSLYPAAVDTYVRSLLPFLADSQKSGSKPVFS